MSRFATLLALVACAGAPPPAVAPPPPAPTAAEGPPAAAPPAPAAAPVEEEEEELVLGPETPPETCGVCHPKQYADWKDSWMGRALRTPTMIMMQRLYMATAKNPDGAYCLRCHSPLMEPLGRTQQVLNEVLFGEVKSQSIGCTGCHMISDLTFNPDDPRSAAENNPNKKFRIALPAAGQPITFFGPHKDARSPKHGAEYRAEFQKSEFCATCHEYSNSGSGGDTPCCTQYSTWRKSKAFAKGQTCQTCHMPRTPNLPIAEVPAGMEQPPARPEGTTFHGFHGGRSPEMVARGAKLEADLRKKGGRAELVVRVTNLAGHDFPDGCPYASELKLFVTVTDDRGQKVFEDLRKYGMEFTDPGTGLTPVEEWAAVKLVSKTALRPDETRTEKFAFAIPEGAADLTAQVKFEYHTLSRMPDIKGNMLTYGPPGLKETMSSPEMNDYMMRLVADIARPIPVGSIEKKLVVGKKRAADSPPAALPSAPAFAAAGGAAGPGGAGGGGGGGDMERAREVYVNVCALCHGKKGTGKTEMGKKLGARDLTDPAVQDKVSDVDIERQILNGAKNPKKMPPLRDKVTAEEAKLLVKYVRTLRRAK